MSRHTLTFHGKKILVTLIFLSHPSGIHPPGRQGPPAPDYAAQVRQEGRRQHCRVQRREATDRRNRARPAPAAGPAVHAPAGPTAQIAHVQCHRNCRLQEAAQASPRKGHRQRGEQASRGQDQLPARVHREPVPEQKIRFPVLRHRRRRCDSAHPPPSPAPAVPSARVPFLWPLLLASSSLLLLLGFFPRKAVFIHFLFFPSVPNTFFLLQLLETKQTLLLSIVLVRFFLSNLFPVVRAQKNTKQETKTQTTPPKKNADTQEKVDKSYENVIL